MFETDGDRHAYLRFLKQYADKRGLSIWAYCVMTNHVHLVAVPQREESLGLALRDAHTVYGMYLNSRTRLSGHVWQGRFYSCPLSGNGPYDVEPWADLSCSLTDLNLAHNDIRYLQPLTSLTSLVNLNLSDNLIDTIAPLAAANASLGADDTVDLTLNYPGAASFPDDVATLEARGVTVLLDEEVGGAKSGSGGVTN